MRFIDDDHEYPSQDDETDAFSKEVADRYVIERPVGTGRTGMVFRAWDKRQEIWVSIKLLNDSLASNSRAIKRFHNEVKAMADINHPHVLSLLDTGHDSSGRPYHVMELVDGITLLQAISKGYFFSEVEACDIALDLLAGLAQLHDRGRVHRDIKPSNILLHPNGDALLGGFDIVRMDDAESTDEITEVGDVIGQLGYISNEQRGDPHNVSQQADLYSIGALLFAMLVGQPPVDLSVASQRKGALADVPNLIAPIIRRATAWRAEERFDSAVEMAVALLDVRDEIAKTVGKPIRGEEWISECCEPTGSVPARPSSTKRGRGRRPIRRRSSMIETPRDAIELLVAISSGAFCALVIFAVIWSNW